MTPDIAILARLRRHSRHIIMAVTMLVIAVAVCGCGDNRKRYRIGIAQCSNDDWRAKMNEEVMREAMFRDDVEVEIRSADDSNEKQIADIRYFIDNDFDIILTAPNEPGPITPVVKEAYEKGIPVITYDRGITGDTYTAHIEVDNYALGASAAGYARNLFPTGEVKVIEIQGIGSMTPTHKRHAGFADELAKSPRFKTVTSVYGNWDPDVTAVLTDSLLKAHPDVNLIYAHNDRMAIAAARTARARGFDNIRFLGIDGSPNIGIRAVVNGEIDATFLYPTNGDLIFNKAMAILTGEPYTRLEKISPPAPITPATAEMLLRQDSLLRTETGRISRLQGVLHDTLDREKSRTAMMWGGIVIIFLLAGVIFLMLWVANARRRYQANLLAKNSQLEEERDKQTELNTRLKEATDTQLRFYTNVAHDLRTPLTLIAAPVDELVGSPDLPAERRADLLEMAQRNISVLTDLVSQILDLRKAEEGRSDFNPACADIIPFLRERLERFRLPARRRDIRLDIEIPEGEKCLVLFDPRFMERIIFNLMSNALKFTPPCGCIKFGCKVEGEEVILSVEDTGSGIPERELSLIFDRFHKADKVHPDGSGIGLSLVKIFTEMHGGTVSVANRPEGGAIFTVRLQRNLSSGSTSATTPTSTPNNAYPHPIPAPCPIPSAMSALQSAESIPAAHENDQTGSTSESGDGIRYTLLVIDDNPDILDLISELMSEEYDVVTSRSGAEGIKTAMRRVPDLIICDVMMEGMDGYECCRRLKEETATSHIPVLLLTACALDEQRIAGYDSGADGYMSKPFNAAVLRARCRNLIEGRRRIDNLYRITVTSAKTDSDKPNGPARTVSARDNDFYSRFITLVEQHLSNADLSVEWIASEMGLGQSQFGRKIKALTGKNPVEIIRNLRMRRGRAMLMSTDRNISEVAFAVGFSSAAYFSKCYRDAFGETPSDLRAKG